MSARPPRAVPSAALVASRFLWAAGAALGLVVATGMSYLVAIPVLIVVALGCSLGEWALLRRRRIEERDVGAVQMTPGALWLGLSAIVFACISVGLARSDWRVAIVAALWFAAVGIDVLRTRGVETE